MTGASEHPAGQGLSGFQVRRPQSHEFTQLLAFFPDHPLGKEQIVALGAFGQPGDVPFGAAIVRPSGPKNSIGNFLVFVNPEFRRRKVGTMLMRHLYSLALSNKAEKLVVPQLLHQDDPELAFYRAVGLDEERSYATYSVETKRALAFWEPIVRRYQAQIDAQQIKIQFLSELDRNDVASFFCIEYGGFFDQRMADLQSGVYDLSLSCAAVRNNKIVGAWLGRSRSDVTSLMLEIIVTAGEYRNSPLPLLLLAHAYPAALQRNLTHCVFEADERYDRFAVGFARRCGQKAQGRRFRYAIGAEEMRRFCLRP